MIRSTSLWCPCTDSGTKSSVSLRGNENRAATAAAASNGTNSVIDVIHMLYRLLQRRSYTVISLSLLFDWPASCPPPLIRRAVRG